MIFLGKIWLWFWENLLRHVYIDCWVMSGLTERTYTQPCLCYFTLCLYFLLFFIYVFSFCHLRFTQFFHFIFYHSMFFAPWLCKVHWPASVDEIRIYKYINLYKLYINVALPCLMAFDTSTMLQTTLLCSMLQWISITVVFIS